MSWLDRNGRYNLNSEKVPHILVLTTFTSALIQLNLPQVQCLMTEDIIIIWFNYKRERCAVMFNLWTLNILGLITPCFDLCWFCFCFFLFCFICPVAVEQPDLVMINQRIRDNIQALNNFKQAREDGRWFKELTIVLVVRYLFDLWPWALI